MVSPPAYNGNTTTANTITSTFGIRTAIPTPRSGRGPVQAEVVIFRTWPKEGIKTRTQGHPTTVKWALSKDSHHPPESSRHPRSRKSVTT